MHAAVTAALLIEPPAERDRAVAALALTYAEQIDAMGDLTKLGPSLLGALEALQMSPRARAVAHGKGGQNAAPAKSKLDELRDRRARKGRASDLDTPAL